MAHCRYNHYKASSTVEEALGRGASVKDLEFDYARGYMTLLGVEENWATAGSVCFDCAFQSGWT